MTTLRVVFLAVSVLACTSAWASDFEVTPVGGLTFTTSTVAPSSQGVGLTQSMGTGFAAGALGTYHLGAIELELGILYAHQVANTSDNGTTDGNVGSLSVTLNSIQVPLIVRYDFLPYLGAGAGVYYSDGVGNFNATGSFTSGGVPNTVNNNESYSQADVRQNDFGVVLSVKGSYPITTDIKAVLDARYLFGLFDQDTTGVAANATYNREIQLLAGVSFGI